jgi:hypothetical protein
MKNKQQSKQFQIPIGQSQKQIENLLNISNQKELLNQCFIGNVAQNVSMDMTTKLFPQFDHSLTSIQT